MDSLQIFSNFSPVIVQPSVKETDQQFTERWNKFDRLPDSIKNKLSDKKTSDFLMGFKTFFALELTQIACVSRAIRSYYFGELKLEEMPFLLAKEIPIDLSKAQEITKLVQEKIINDNSQEIAHQAQLEHLPLADALKVFPEIGEQMLTSEKISLKNFPEPVRPSLKNWLADYVFTVGYNNKDSIKRGDYIFHGSNTQRLNSIDRDKLAYILKAHDENTAITINKETKQLVFPAAKQERHLADKEITRPIPNTLNNPQSSDKLHNSVSFSSPQQLPYEKLTTPQPKKQEFVSQVKFPPIQPTRPTNPLNNIVKLEPKSEAPKQFPKNVVNLRDEQ